MEYNNKDFYQSLDEMLECGSIQSCVTGNNMLREYKANLDANGYQMYKERFQSQFNNILKKCYED